MMIQEFVDLTGIAPTAEEYVIIEEMYYNFDGDKKAFCKSFVESSCMEAVKKQILSNLHEELTQVYNKLSLQAKEIDTLKSQLEREQEWRLYENEHNVKQCDYERLAKYVGNGGARYMTDEEAIDWVVQETGFARERIQIVHELPMEEINRHHQVRKTGKMLDRRPIYDATDYHYIAFNVRANITHGWELHNDELTPYWD